MGRYVFSPKYGYHSYELVYTDKKNLFQPTLPCILYVFLLIIVCTSHCTFYICICLFCCCFVYTYCPSLDVVLEPGVQGLVSKLKVKVEVLHSLLHRGHSPPVRQGQRHLEVQVRLLVLDEYEEVR